MKMRMARGLVPQRRGASWRTAPTLATNSSRRQIARRTQVTAGADLFPGGERRTRDRTD